MSIDGLLKATVTAAPAPGSTWCSVRVDGGLAQVPAQVPGGVSVSVSVGARVYLSMVGRRPIVRGNV